MDNIVSKDSLIGMALADSEAARWAASFDEAGYQDTLEADHQMGQHGHLEAPRPRARGRHGRLRRGGHALGVGSLPGTAPRRSGPPALKGEDMDKTRREKVRADWQGWLGDNSPADWQDEIPFWAAWYATTEEGSGLTTEQIEKAVRAP